MDAIGAPVDRPSFLIRYRFWILLLLAAVGGVARFAALDRPPLWGDEAFTYYRTSGTFHQLLDIIQFNGFPPLHYEAYWELKQLHKLTPRTMRIIPATAGTLMIPAMYFLASQLVRRRVALLVALFTSCSAYMMVYAHDAKMYMACWLFVALHMGCLLWWLRRGRSGIGRIAWLGWIASGIAAVGLHYSACLLPPLELIICLTYPLVIDSPAYWKRILLYLLGTTVIAAGPIGFFVGFNRIGEKFDQRGFAWGSETMWVESYNIGRAPMDLALYTATAHLYSWEWPQDASERHSDVYAVHTLMIVGVVLLLLLAVAAMPWRARQESLPSGVAAGLLPWWLLYLWLGIWIVATAYGLYCASTKHFASPTAAFASIGSVIGHSWWAPLALLGEIVMLALLSRVIEGFAIALATAIPIIAGLALFGAFLPDPQKVSTTPWDSRYWLALTHWWHWVADGRILLILLGILPALAWHFSAETYVGRFKRLAQFLGVSAVIFGVCWLIWTGFDHHVRSLIQKAVNEHHVDPKAAEDQVWSTWLSLWMPRYLGVVWPAVAIAACLLLMRLPTRPLRYLAIILLLGINVVQATARLFVTTEPPADQMVADIAATQNKASDTRVYFVNVNQQAVPSPGSLSLVGPQARYYLSQVTSRAILPHDFKFSSWTVPETAKIWGFTIYADRSASEIAKDANAAGDIRDLLVWEGLPPDAQGSILNDLTKSLGPGWRLQSTSTFYGHDHWTWTHLWQLRRYEFARTAR